MAQKQYSCIVFFENDTPKKWRNVTNFYSFSQFLDRTYNDWLYINVYDRKTKQYVRRFYKGSYIPFKL